MFRAVPIAIVSFVLMLVGSGCARGPGFVPVELRKPIDRSLVEFPAGMQFERYITNLTAPTAIAFDTDRNAMLVAESGGRGGEPRIYGFNLDDNTTFTVYPQGRAFLGFRSSPFRMYGPIGGMTVRDGVIYVSHRDAEGLGVISALGYDGKGTTVIAGLPAQGDHSVTDVIFGPDGRLYFGVGSATNSGVVGLDNWKVGWVQKHPLVADRPYAMPNNATWRLRGPKFFTNNPRAGLFTGSELAITAPFQPFGQYTRSRIIGAAKPNAAVYSVQPTGGIASDLRIEAHGIRMPAGLAFNAYDQLFATNQGMELRGTRPVRDDPNTVVRVYRGRWYGWPDFSANLLPITDDRFQPDEEMIRRTGYTELNFLFDHPAELGVPFADIDVQNMVRAVFPSLCGAAKMTFLPTQGPLSEFDFRGNLIVALSGDRSPFANSGQRLIGPIGHKVVRVDVERDAPPRDFIRNTSGVPRSRAPGDARANIDLLERPIDVKVGPDGYLYVLDFGRLEVRNGKERIGARTGQVFRLRPTEEPETQPVASEAGDQ